MSTIMDDIRDIAALAAEIEPPRRTLRDSATEAKLWLQVLLDPDLSRDRNGDPIQWTEGGKRTIRKLIADLEFDLRMDSLSPLNEPERYTDG